MRFLRAPFPWFGGKSRVAHLVWERFGDVRNYVEPFFGSGAVLLGRPGEAAIETVNDADGYLCNFWRAVAADPDQVASYADWPVNEVDLHARHRWLVETGRERVERLKTDPEYFDAKVAGWWVWGQCLWIGSGWCARPEWTGRGSAACGPRGINAQNFGKLPAVAGRDGGHAKSRHANGTDAEKISEWEPRPDLSAPGGRGVIIKAAQKRPVQKMPDLAHTGGNVGVHKPSLAEKRPLLTGNNGGNVGINATSLGAAAWAKRPVLQHGEGGRGVHRLEHHPRGLEVSNRRPALGSMGGNNGVHRRGILEAGQIPSLRGDSGAAGQGIHASGFLARSGGMQAYMRALSDRLRRVRVCCGDFERILGPAVTTCIGTTGIFLDPPYPEEGRAICYSHDGDAVWWRAYQWAIDNGDNPELRIALCGYEHADAIFPADWTALAWKASGGYGRSPRGKANALRERIWFSPHCLRADQPSLFELAELTT